AEDAVLVPAVGAGARVVMREVVPRRAVGAVILAHRAPGPVCEKRPPAIPVRGPSVVVGQPLAFGSLGRLHASFPGSCQPWGFAVRRSASFGPQVPGA